MIIILLATGLQSHVEHLSVLRYPVHAVINVICTAVGVGARNSVLESRLY